ncbi:MAG: hypothetical protein UC708_06525 [Anaerovoracaceae bacterium]|nr:hypothetical protein [Anaerovoracaceae bacterium]
MSETTYELRKLEAKDIAPMASILSKVGIREVKNCFSPDDMKVIANSEGNMEAVGAVGVSVAFEIAGVILRNYERCQNDIFSFLSSLSGMDIKQIESLPLDTFTEMVIDVVKKEEFKDFIKVVSKLFK